MKYLLAIGLALVLAPAPLVAANREPADQRRAAYYPGIQAAKAKTSAAPSPSAGGANQNCGQTLHGQDGCQFYYAVTCGKSVVSNGAVTQLSFGGYYGSPQGCANLCDHWAGCNVANYTAPSAPNGPGRCDVYAGGLYQTFSNPNGYLIQRTVPGGVPSAENCVPGFA